jgi:amino acid permease
VKKLGPIATCFTIFKGFVATGVLYVPKDFKNGGYIFTPITLIISLVATLYCSKLLLDVNERLGGGGFPEMGFRAYGKAGKIFVEIVLVASQFGFCTAYVYFIANQIGGKDGVIP